jgi:hypothetical protein
MPSVVDVLERMGSEARWRRASQDDVEATLVDAGVEAPMRAAILAKNVAEVQTLLGRVKMMPQQTPTPEPAEIPRPPQPEPGETEEDEEDGDTPAASKPSHSVYGAPLPSSRSSF